MSIAKRITLILLVALAALLVVAGNSLYSLGQANARFEYVDQNTIPSIRILYEINQAVEMVRITTRDFVAAENGAERVRNQKLLEDAGKLIETDLNKYKNELLSDEQDKALVETELKAWATVQDKVRDIMQRTRSRDGEAGSVHGMFAPAGEFSLVVRPLVDSLGKHMDFNWQLFYAARDRNRAEYATAKWLQIGVFIAAAILLIFMGGTVAREISSRLTRLASFMGDVSTTLNFTQRLRITRMDELGRTGDAFNKLLDKMQANLKEIASAAQSVAGSASTMASTSTQVADAAHQQSESASTMAATVEEMTVSVNHVANRATETSRLVSDAGELAQTGETIIGQVATEINAIATTVSEAEEQIRTLESHSQDIASIVQVIKDVADQTNLLALNAAIEAARAGEQGRGFAVVADEVRKLAERTASSTHEITTTVEIMRSSAHNAVGAMQSVVGKVSEGVNSAGVANSSIERIGTSSREAVDMVSEIATAIREQGAATDNIARQVENIAQMSEESSAAAHNTAEVAERLNGLAGQMQKIIGHYTLDASSLTIR